MPKRNPNEPEVDGKKSGIISAITNLFRRIAPDIFLDIPTTERDKATYEDVRLFDLDPTRQSKYKDYNTMDEEIVELSSALDIHADYITAADSETGEVYSVELGDEDEEGEPAKMADGFADAIEEIDEKLQLKQRAWFVARNIAKNGEAFYENVCSSDELINTKYLPEKEMFINYDENTGRQRKDKPYIQRDLDTWAILAEFDPWEIVHFKVGEEDYGVDFSVLAKMRRGFRIERLLEDSLIVTRLTRSGQRGVYKVDCSGMGELETARYIRHLKILNRRRRFFDSTGKMRTEADPLTQQDDIYIPTRKGGADSDYTVVGGDPNLGQIADIEHFHNKMFAATKVPKAFLGYERDINAKSTLIQQNIAFTRAIKRQRFALAQGYKKIYKVGLALKGLDPYSFEWKIRFPVLGEADEESKWKIEQLKAEVVRTYGEVGLHIPNDWVIHRLFLDLSPSDADELSNLVAKQKEEDDAEAQRKAQQQVQQQTAIVKAKASPSKQAKKPGPKGTPLSRTTPPYTLARPDSFGGKIPSTTELDDLYQKIRSNESLWSYIKDKESEIKRILRGHAKYEKY